MAPELDAIALAAQLRTHDEQANKAVGGVVTDPGNAADRRLVKPAQPQPLAIGLAIDGHIAAAGGKALLARPGGDQGNLGFLQGPDLEAGSGLGAGAAWGDGAALGHGLERGGGWTGTPTSYSLALEPDTISIRRSGP